MGIKERTVQYLDYKGISKTKAEQLLNWGKGLLIKANSISADKAGEFLLLFNDLSAEWLLRGEGSMLKSSDSPLVINGEGRGVPYYSDLPVSAGQLDTIIQDSEPSGWVDLPGVRSKALFPVVGCSMKPEINPGDVVGIVQIDSWEVMDPDKVYLVITTDDRMIKHLAVDEADDSIFWCISPNYPKFKLNKEDIKFLYRISFCGKLM